MGSLTLRHGLDELTMTSLAGVISPAALLHPYEHWCPICLEDWRAQESDIYIPLLWQIRAVSICPHHQCALQENCTHCGRNHRPLARHGNPGYCPWCRGWLGASVATQLKEAHRGLDLPFAQFMGSEVLDLIIHRTRFAGSSAGPFAANVAKLFEHHSGSFSGFSRQVHHHPKSVRFWIEKRQLPRLYAVLVIAYRFGIKAIDLLTSDLETSPRFDPRTLSARTTATLKPKLHRHDAEVLRRCLEDALKSKTYPPPSVASIARGLRCHSGYLKRKFSELTSQISKEYRQYWSIHKSQRLYFAKLLTKSRTSEIAARGEYPSISKVKTALPPGVSFRMPIVKEAWQETLQEWGLRSPSIDHKRL
jgi:AraC-like DNA-binding protein